MRNTVGETQDQIRDKGNRNTQREKQIPRETVIHRDGKTSQHAEMERNRAETAMGENKQEDGPGEMGRDKERLQKTDGDENRGKKKAVREKGKIKDI